MAGLLGVALEKRRHYIIGGGFRPPRPADIGVAARLAYIVAGLGAPLVVGVMALWGVAAA